MKKIRKDIVERIRTYNWLYVLYGAILLSFTVGAILAALQQNWDSVTLGIASAVLFGLPFVLQKQLKIYFPTSFCLLISLFLYATIILGQIEGFYQKFWWWDSMLHAGSGLAFGLVGLVVILIFFQLGKIAAPPLIVSLFAFCFALSVGLLWEVFEFLGDLLVHTNMQQVQTGVVDTMKDLIMDTIGAFLGAAIGYLYLRRGMSTPLDGIIAKAVRKNRTKPAKSSR